MPSSFKRTYDDYSDHDRRECKTVVGGHVDESSGRSYMWDFCICGSRSKGLLQCLVGSHVGESSSKSIMPQSAEWPTEDKIDQIRKKSKRAVDYHLGESNDGSSASDFFACGRLCLSCRFPTITFSVTSLQLEESTHRWLETMRLIMQKIVPKTDTQMSFRKEREFAVDWSELVVDILVRIAEEHLLSPDDFAMFSSVCRSWHCAAAACNLVKLNKKWIHNQMPWVMLTDGEIPGGDYSKSPYVLPRVLNDIEEFDNDKGIELYVDQYTRCALSLRSKTCLKMKCPQGFGRVCWGSGHGWIVTAGGDGLMFMFNPFTKSRVSLPSFGTFRWRWDNEDEVRRNLFVTKAVVLDVGGDDDAQNSGDGVLNLRVIVFYGNDHVAIVKPGNRRWIEIEGEARTYSPLMDVTYDTELGLIFVDNSGGFLCCSVPEKEESPFLKWFQPPLEHYDQRTLSRTYIVKCGADLLLITRYVDFDDSPDRAHSLFRSGFYFVDKYMTVYFEVQKYDFEKKTWVTCRRLKDVALFVGNNTSMWVHEPGDGCIYFNDDLRSRYADTKYKLGGHDCGVFKLNHRKAIGRGCRFEFNLYGGSDNRSGYCGPFFFKPSICVSKVLN